jgi:hypothetical protein
LNSQNNTHSATSYKKTAIELKTMLLVFIYWNIDTVMEVNFIFVQIHHVF